MKWDAKTRATALAAAGAVVIAGLGLWGLASAQAAVSHPEAASGGRVMEVRYEVRREAAYTPPPPSEATRLDTLPGGTALVAADALVAPEVAIAWKTLQVDESQRMRESLAAIHAEDRRIDREMRASLARVRADYAPAYVQGGSLYETRGPEIADDADEGEAPST